jgi:hypothetical protein
MNKLTQNEKEYLRHFIENGCKGTPLQPNAEFAGGYLTTILVPIIENFEMIREELKKDPDCYKT